jgi:two-component system NtrC family sensor kinase
MQLARKLSLGLFLGVLAVFAVSAYLRIQKERSLLETSMRNNQRLIATTLAAALDEVWRAEGESRVLDLVRRAGDTKPDLYLRWVRDGSGAPPSFARAGLAAFEAAQDVALTPAGSGATEERLFTYVPLPPHGASTAALEVSEPTAPRREYVRSAVIAALLSSLAMALVSGAVAMLLGAWVVGRPVQALIARARAIGQGDFSRRATLSQSDELGALAVELDAMCGQLETARDRVAKEAAARIAAVEQLRHAERLTTLGRLASVIAHEIGTPLGVVSGYAKMVSTGKVRDAEAADAAGIMLEQCGRISRIVRRVLDYARRSEPRKQVVPVGDVLGAGLALLEPLAQKRGVRLSFERAAEFEARLDSAQIQQAVTNLVMNAIQATESGGVVTVRLDAVEAPVDSAGSEPRHIRVSVIDSGPGVAEDVLERIWEPFFTTKPSAEGTGLGLSITKDIVDEHGGLVTVRSRPGHGSCFEILLPKGEPA